MAWMMRITELTGDASGGDITLQGRFRAVVEYFDDGDPGVILTTQNFEFGYGITAADAIGKMKEYARRIRDTRALIANQQVNIGMTLPLD